ncbi:uncharacterized protein LOC127256702 isoform X2 [Andrographis paniculata]|uniref:uncharacterized protein LOC127256702 isoform X2 n=1 Tax=Andrographis paniculata TaxID=175694 RepID=UPI0021E8EE04|nr:uncharacterized protein LOC127256702 isoform X2 [Andrographis paniculata]
MSKEARKVTEVDVQYVQNLIELSLKHYMTRSETVKKLNEHADIKPCFTELVWKVLEEQNREFFRVYHLRLKLKEQIKRFNELLQIQYELTRQLNQTAAVPNLIPNGPLIHPMQSSAHPTEPSGQYPRTMERMQINPINSIPNVYANHRVETMPMPTPTPMPTLMPMPMQMPMPMPGMVFNNQVGNQSNAQPGGMFNAVDMMHQGNNRGMMVPAGINSSFSMYGRVAETGLPLQPPLNNNRGINVGSSIPPNNIGGMNVGPSIPPINCAPPAPMGNPFLQAQPVWEPPVNPFGYMPTDAFGNLLGLDMEMGLWNEVSSDHKYN